MDKHMAYQITKNLRPFSAAHRVHKGYQGKCKHLHGHNYAVELSVASTQLDQYGFVIDFDDISKFFDGWIQENWDHATLVSADDPDLLNFVKAHQQKYYLFPETMSTTVENLAKYLFNRIADVMRANPDTFPEHIQLVSIEIWETDNSSAKCTATAI